MKDKFIAIIENMLLSMDSNVDKVVSILSENFWGVGNTWYDFAILISTLLEPISLSIATACFLIEYINITSKFDVFKWEIALRMALKLVLTKAMIEMTFSTLNLIYLTVMDWIVNIGTTQQGVGSLTWSIISLELDNYGTMDLIGLIASMGIMFIAIYIISLLVQVIAYARKFEIILYLGVSSIPVAFFPIEGLGITKNFFLSFASVCMQGVFIIMSIKLYGMLCSEEISLTISSGGDIGSITGQLFIATLVLATAVFKSSTFANKIFHVN